MDRMRRGVSPALLEALGHASIHPIVLVDVDWPDEPVRAHSGVGPITWDGKTWAGVGGFGAVSVGEESIAGMPAEFTASLICDLPEVSEYANANIRRRPGRIFLGATTTAGGNDLIGAVDIAAGTMDALDLRLDAKPEQTIYDLTVGFTTGPSFRTAASAFHSHEDQSRRHPGDTAGKKLIQAQTRAEKTRWPE